jgi:hypothetical protein
MYKGLPRLILTVVLLTIYVPRSAGNDGPVREGDQLPKGAADGRFHFSQHLEFTFSAAPVPIIATVRTVDGSKVDERNLAGGSMPELSIDVRPGTYYVQLTADTKDRKDGTYGSVVLPKFHVTKEGRIHFPSGQTQTISFLLEITGMRPGGSAVVADRRPTLHWDPVDGAAYYIVTWVDPENADPVAKVSQPEYHVKDPLREAEEYGWRVSAYTANDHLLASGKAWFVPPNSDLAKPDTRPAKKVGEFYGVDGIAIGESVVPILGPPVILPDGREADPRPIDFQPAASVLGLLPGSPGIEAGLLPDDLIVKVNGKPLLPNPETGRGQSSDLIQKIEHLRSGEAATLTIRRNGGPERDVRLQVGVRPKTQ